MKLRTIALVSAALSLVATPVLAQVAFERSNAPIEGENSVEGGSTLLFALIGAAAVVGGIIVLSDDDDDPTSP